MARALAKAISQLGDPALRRVVWTALGATVLLFVALSGAVWWLFLAVDFSTVPGLGWLHGLLGGAFDWLAGLVVAGALLAASLLLFPGVATVVVGLFLEDVAAAVERRHYPEAPPARRQPLGEALAGSLRFAVTVVAVNLLALPLYAVLLPLPPGTLVAYYLVNGHLAGREYFELVASRRLDRRQAAALRRRHRWRILLAGMIIALMLTVPIVNLLAPIVATAFMVHVFSELSVQDSP